MTVTSTPRLPRYRRAEKAPPMQLTTRDEEIIQWVYQLRFATQEQLQRLLFSPTTTTSCRQRLTLLYHNAYLDRRYLPLRNARGASRAAYCLDERGAKLLRLNTKTGAPLQWRPADNDHELYFLEHTLAINDFRITVTLAAQEKGFNLTWTDERELKSEALKQIVPDPKRRGRRLAVVPDGYFVVEDGPMSQAFALELDRGTVEERAFKEKVRALGEWKTTGAYQRTFKTKSLRVLFVVAPTDRDKNRLARIKRWTEAEGGESLFWFSDLTQVNPESVFNAPIWLVARRNGTFSLL